MLKQNKKKKEKQINPRIKSKLEIVFIKEKEIS
jgi:hypothetical protein